MPNSSCSSNYLRAGCFFASKATLNAVFFFGVWSTRLKKILTFPSSPHPKLWFFINFPTNLPAVSPVSPNICRTPLWMPGADHEDVLQELNRCGISGFAKIYPRNQYKSRLHRKTCVFIISWWTVELMEDIIYTIYNIYAVFKATNTTWGASPPCTKPIIQSRVSHCMPFLILLLNVLVWTCLRHLGKLICSSNSPN